MSTDRVPLTRILTTSLVTLVLASACAPAPDATALSTADVAAPYFPPASADWRSITAEEAGFDPAALERALDYVAAQRSSSVVLLAGGRLLAERTWAVPDRENSRYSRMVVATTADGLPIEDVASVQKGVVSFLVGIAEGQGLLDLDAPASRYLGEGWSLATPEQEAEIALIHLLTMTSGLLTDRTFEAPAGERWRYNTNVYSRLLPVLEAATGKTIDDLTAEWLTEPLAMTSSHWAPRPWITEGQDANRVGFATTARDLARFGLFILRQGGWNGADLLKNPTYLERATVPSQDLNPAYGYLWWLNGQERYLRAAGAEEHQGPLLPNAPSDLIAALGALGRTCYVVPSLDLVVTRLGDRPDPDFGNELWRLLMAARR